MTLGVVERFAIQTFTHLILVLFSTVFYFMIIVYHRCMYTDAPDSYQ